ncbi:MAG: hypothetical protein COB67_13845 [SAR324 cluster bacterium]|uniref:HTH cro/C1-type domain-containing protein n=1 Tax=SAR324 cluster bacterium TaxID=2024889 RepID=A0A2A4SKM2_9DELT|nr:MAG: hypothetical protein COB67_13845 [SAR324 cluster bacterium]
MNNNNESQIQEQVGLKIRELRKSARISTVDLSGEAGISQGQLSKIENGKATISIKVLSLLCEVFNRPISYLFQKEEEIPQVLGTLVSEPGPEKQGIQRFASEVNRISKNRISLIPLWTSQLGQAANHSGAVTNHSGVLPNQVEYLQQGLIDLFIDDLSMFNSFVTDFNIFALPYVFSDIDHLMRFLNGDYFNERLRQPLLNAGIRLINPSWNWLRGIERVLVSKEPIFSPDDIKGKNVRVHDCPALIKYWEDMGANPVFVPWAEVKQALEQGIIDVIPSYTPNLFPLKFCDTAKYITRIGGIPSVLGIAMNEVKYQLFSPTLQSALGTASQKAGNYFSTLVQETVQPDEASNIEHFQANYLKVNVKPWKAKLEKTIEALIKEKVISKDLWREVKRLDAESSEP